MYLAQPRNNVETTTPLHIFILQHSGRVAHFCVDIVIVIDHPSLKEILPDIFTVIIGC